MKHIIGLPDGRQILLSEYLRSWKKLLTLPPQTSVERWEWFPCSAAEILRQISAGVHDRINQRGGLSVRQSTARQDLAATVRVHRKLRTLVLRDLLSCPCRWCGRELVVYHSPKNRFCDLSCERAFYS